MSGLFAIISPDFFKGVIFIKLHKSQLILIRHLIRFNVLDYESCLELLDIENTNDKIAMSYMFRPLTKYNYISKNENSCVTVLKKGKACFPNEHKYISEGSSEQTKQRVMQVSRIAACMEKLGIRNTDKLLNNTDIYFIPSACWRNIAPGILSTTRFVGMLIAYNKKYAVYDIGDGSMEWQVRAESSLFYTKYGHYETKADGMIMICDSGKRNTIAENIIRHTMWNRKSLLNGQYTERERPVRFSRSPIKLRTQYERVYLITKDKILDGLKWIFYDDYIIANTIENSRKLNDPKLGDVEIWPKRYFINPAFDLLKLVYFFSAVKSHHELEKSFIPSSSNIEFVIIVQREDLSILRMYPDVFYSEKVEIHELQLNEHA